jgi:hypothetical protein
MRTGSMRKSQGSGRPRLRVSLVTSLLILGAVPTEAQERAAIEPIALVRQVSGSARISAGGHVRRAQPFVALALGDSIAVDSGRVVIYMRSGEEQVLTSGSRFVMPPVPPPPDSSLWTKVVSALKMVLQEPRQMARGVVRGTDEYRVPVWPSSALFNVGSLILFQWPDSAEAGLLLLRGPMGAVDSSRVMVRAPKSPMDWPAGFPCKPGLYRWELYREEGSPVLGAGWVELLSDREAADLRATYLARPGKSKTASMIEVLGEVLAAADGCFFH